MRDQVTRHLERARIAARVAVVGTITEVVPVVQALARTMEKIHHDKDIAIDLDIQRRGAVSRRAAGPGGDGRQPGRQRLQMGGLAGLDRGDAASSRSRAGRSCASWSTTTGRGLRRRSASRCRGAASGSTRPSRARGSACRSWSSLPALYGGALNLGTAPIGGLRAELVLPAG